MWEDNRVPMRDPLSHPQAGCIQSINSYLNSAFLLLQNLSLWEMWREAPGVLYGAAMGRSCLCTGGTATEMCKLAAMTTLGRASTCSSLITHIPCCATRLSTSTSTTLAEGCWARAGFVSWLVQAGCQLVPLVYKQEPKALCGALKPRALPGMPDYWPHVAFPLSWLLQVVV